MCGIGAILIIFGVMAQLILDGQVFSHAVLGIAFGLCALLCGIAIMNEEPPDLLTGRTMFLLGLLLAIWCMSMLPEAYEYQHRFNERQNQHRKG